MTNGSSLIGFTLTNGATLQVNYPATGTNNNHNGGGIWCINTTAIISNCVITGNSAAYNGGGAHYSTLYNCTLIANVAKSGGGTYYGVIYNSTIIRNSSSGTGAGALQGVVSNCTLIGNSTAGSGGGAAYLTMYNCTIVSNSAAASGGGVYGYGSADSGTKLYNCLIVGNSSGSGGSGGGVKGAFAYNCTIVGNYSTDGGGMRDGVLYNCIVYYNSVDNWSHAPSFTNCCTTPVPTNGWAVGNITSDPIFVANGSDYGTNHVAGNYRLRANSPCVNTGTNGNWTATYPYDLDGRTRIRYGTVDMGTYERLHKGTVCGVH